MPVQAETYVIDNQKQLLVLTSAVRQEIVDVLSQMGSASVSEIAAALARPADSLYYHLRALYKVGLVLQAGSRSRGYRQEALFRTVTPELKLRYETSNEPNRNAVTAIVGSMLRLGIRDFRRAFQRPGVKVSGSNRELWALRRTGWLSLKDVAAVNRSIQQLACDVARTRGEGRLYAITILLTPLDERKGRRERRNSKRRKNRKSINQLS